jgi:WD40 repeat protein
VRNLAEQAGVSDWADVPLDEMTPTEALALLGRGLPLHPPAATALAPLAGALGGWPLLLELVNARLLEEKKARPSVVECIERVTTLFEDVGVLAFDRSNQNARNAAIEKSVQIGLEFAEELAGGIRERTFELSIFPEDTPIPVAVLADLWATKELLVEERTLRHLDNLSIARWDRAAGTVRLHDMIRLALAAQLKQPEAVHRRLLEAWGNPHALASAYAWRWYGWHCREGAILERLRALLLDCEWLLAKLRATGVSALVADYAWLPELKDVEEALLLASHVIAEDPDQLRGQLLGRLSGDAPGVRALIDSASRHDGVWLQPLLPSLRRPGGALLRTLMPGVGRLIKVAFASAGTAVVAVGDGKVATISVSSEAVEVVPIGSTDNEGEPLRVGHIPAGSAPTSAALTPDGRLVLLGYGWMTMGLLELPAQPLRGIATEHRGQLETVDLDRSGRLAVSGSLSGVELQDLVTGSVVDRIGKRSNMVRFIRGAEAVLIAAEGGLWRWDLGVGRGVTQLPVSRLPVRGVTTTGDGRKCIVWFNDWAQVLHPGQPGVSLEREFSSEISACEITSDGATALVALWGGLLVRWDLEQDACSEVVSGHAQDITSVAISPNDRVAATASNDESIKLWDLQRFDRMANDDWTGRAQLVAFARAEPRALSLIEHQGLSLWDLTPAPPHVTWTRATAEPVRINPGIACCAASRDLRYLVVAHTFEVFLHDLQTKECDAVIRGSSGVRAVALTSDSRRVLALHDLQTLNVFDRETRELRTHALDFERPLALTTTTNEVMVVSEDGWVHIYNLDTGEGQGKFSVLVGPAPSDGPVRSLSAAAATDTGQVITAAENGTVLVCHVFDSRRLHFETGLAPSHKVLAIDVDPTGTYVITCTSDRAVRLWHVAEKRVLAAFKTDSMPTACALSPDARTLIVGTEADSVHFLGIRNLPG